MDSQAPAVPVSASTVGSAVCYCKNGFMPESQASIGILDHGLLYGDGVFDTVVAWKGNLFRFAEHAERLLRSMKAVGLAPPITIKELLSLTREAVQRNGLDTAYIKWIVSRGSNDTPLMDPKGCKPYLLIIVRPYIERFTSRSEEGIALKTVAIRRTPNQCLDARIKNLNYLNLILAKMEAKSCGADEALMLDTKGNICEAPGYNVFVAREGVLATPTTDILKGITRDSVFAIARTAGVEVVETDLALYDVYTAEECFLTSTAGGLVPVTRVDGRVIGSGRPGPLFRAFSGAYADMLESPTWGVPLSAASSK